MYSVRQNQYEHIDSDIYVDTYVCIVYVDTDICENKMDVWVLGPTLCPVCIPSGVPCSQA